MALFLKLDRMEILGFKSFYGRTRFDFPAGITAVVGPNGCGKSNIGDAISWVLGEQKASSLRSDRMEDVIFNGSQGRRPLGMAEVSLHFRNISAGDGKGAPGNGHAGNGGGGNGHGAAPAPVRPETDVPVALPAAVGELADASAAPPVEAQDSPAVEGPASEGSAADESTAAGSRFFLENLPEEVVVTRRLYRSGESEYALNGQRCRLRDIQDLLARTEIGSRLYTTIEQGKIDQILAAKPKDRRAIIEEAAGILGYKTKRRQAEMKLEATQANLLRLSDIIVEVEKQISALRRQAGKARRYRRLLERLRRGKAVIAHRRLLAYDEEERVTTALLAALGGREGAAAADLARAEADLEALRLKLDGGEEAARRRRDELHALDMGIDRLQGRIRAGEEQARDLAARTGDADREIGALQERAAQQQGRREALGDELAEVSGRVREGTEALDRCEAARRERAGAIAAHEAALEEERRSLLRQLDVLAENERRRAALEEQVRSGGAASARLERDAADAAVARGRLAEETARLELRAAALQAGDAELRAERETRLAAERQGAAELGTRERQAEERRGRAAALAERLEALRALERERAGYAEGVGEILRGAAGFAPAGAVGEKLDVPAGYERAAAAALDSLCDAVVVVEALEGVRGVAYLRAGHAGRVSFVAAGADAPPAPALPDTLAGRAGVAGTLRDRVKGLDGVPAVDAALARTVLADDLDLAIELQRTHPGWAFVTPAGDIVRADGVITGGDGSQQHHGLLARRAEMAGIARQIETAQIELRAADAEVDAMRSGHADLGAALGAADGALQDADKEALSADLLLRERRSEQARLGETIGLLDRERARIAAEVKSAGAEAGLIAAARAAADARRREQEGGIRGASEGLAEERSDLERLQREVAEAGAAVAAGEQRLAALGRERDALDEALGETRARAGARAGDRAAAVARLAEIAAIEGRLRQDLQRSLDARAAAAARDEAGLAGLAYDRSLAHAREQAAKEGRAAHAALRDELQQLEVRRARLASDLEHLEATCREDLTTTFEALRAAPPVMEEGRGAEDYDREVGEIKNRLEGIGPVNLMAIEQCGELETRFAYMDAQRKDLEGSIASLRETIRRINRESRERFLAAFEAIQADFQDCYAILFGGGRAELRLQDGEEDVLEAGVEIAAQPPGKKLQSINLLSGGERALTAVALLFSLFRYRPSPFCVLDEVDAPLDEANVERFMRLLQQATQETKFILITHNRKSMEAATLLYGVTMEEPGISKVLPLRFE